MIGLCKDCRYWKYRERDDIDLDTFNDINLEESDIELYYRDSGLDCGLKTGPEFGCVRFRKK